MIRKLIAIGLISLQMTNAGVAASTFTGSDKIEKLGPCSTFMTEYDQENIFFAEKDNLCFIGSESARKSELDVHLSDNFYPIWDDRNLVDSLEKTNDHVAIIVEDDLVLLMSEQTEVLPFIAAVVAIDAALIGVAYTAYMSKF